MSSVVHVASVSTIVPAVPTPQPCILWLCNFQIQLLSENYLKQVYYYPAAVGSSPSSFDLLVSSLRDSLSRILVPYYPIAGRPRISDVKRPVLDCNDQGVEFVVAFAEARFSDWEGSMQHCSIEQELNPPQTEIIDHENFPQLKVQVTKFLCGGIALGLVTTHVITDGSSIFTFFKAWSELHRGLPLPNPPPSFDSRFFQAREPPCVNLPVRDYVRVLTSTVQETGKCTEDIPRYHTRSFRMNELQLSQLKQEISSGPYAYGTMPTSFEAVSALVWKSITESLELNDTATTTFVYSASAKADRNRRQPPIPDEYCGTTAMTLCIPCLVDDIKNKHVSFAAHLLRNDIQNITHERFQSTIDWMELEGIGSSTSGREIGINMKAGTAVYSIDLVTFPVYDVNFGWGRPVHFSLVLEPWYGNGAVVFFPTSAGGKRERRIVVMLLEEQMNRLLQNKLFSKSATLD